jgi:ABC-2 type transport system permease protein
MPRQRELQAIAACFGLGFSQAREQRLALLGQSVLYVIVLAIFWGLWSATPLQELRGAAPSREALLWYLAITEWIVFAAGARYREIEREIASGAIDSALLRPLPHGVATLARWAGGGCYQMAALAVVGTVATWALTGSVPTQVVLAPLVVLSSLLALGLVLLSHLQLGYASVWLGSAAPLFWVWQKLLFVFGGLLFPLLLYPSALRRAAESSPFAAMLSAPASLVFGGDAAHVAALLVGQLLWLAVLGALTLVIARRATARLLRVGS